jgi:hypothetical protein
MGNRSEPPENLRQKVSREIHAIQTNSQLPYLDQTRHYGDGLVRIGTSVNYVTDVANLTYLSLLKDEYIGKFIDVETGDFIPESEQEAIGQIKISSSDVTAINSQLDDQ